MEGTYSNIGGGIVGIEIPINHQTSQTNQNHNLQKHSQIMSNFNNTPQPQDQQNQQNQIISMKHTNINQPLRSVQLSHSPNSDEEEAGHEQDGYSFERKKPTSSSPWQRMKWTDSMVRLLIMAVYYIGDEVGFDNSLEKKKQGGVTSISGVLQKKGKWKSISKAMMEKGFYVSPQQCEDKFNDLNKRYKRVNDILGKGIACKIVENQSLLDNMDISPKLKEEVRKLLNSKHLFFKEMCAYHRSCGHDTGNVTIAHHQINNPQGQGCHHSSFVQTTTMPQPNSMGPTNSKQDDHDEEEHTKSHDDDEEDDEFDDEEDEEEEEHEEEERPRKRSRTTTGGISPNTSLQRFNGEVMSVLQDGSKSLWEKKSWVMTHLIELEEKGVKFRYQEMELEKQRQKWVRFSSKKEREMEKLKVENLKNKVEIEKMIISLKRKELELLGIEHQQRSC